MAGPEWKARMTAILEQELAERASPLLLERLRRQIEETGDHADLPKRLARIRTALRLFVGATEAEQVLSRLNAVIPRA
jgi:hypothetical protein